jgi:hypothetical protein
MLQRGGSGARRSVTFDLQFLTHQNRKNQAGATSKGALMNRLVRDHLKRLHFALYKHALRLGVHIIPAHYYAPLPNIIGLKRSQNLWAKPSAMAGIEIDLDAQVADLRAVCTPFAPEFSGNPHYRHAINQPFPSGRSRFFGYIEAQVLHAVMTRRTRTSAIGLGLDVVQFAGLYQRRDDGPIFSTIIVTGEESILARQSNLAVILPISGRML